MFLDGEGAEVDWIVGYGPPPERFQDKLSKVLAGEETFKSLNAAYAQNPKDVGTVFKLALKWAYRYDPSKTNPLYKEVIALDPEGKHGTYTQEYYNITVPYTEYAEFAIATGSISGQKPDLDPVKAFLAKYPKSPLMKQMYDRMSSYYSYQAPQEEADKFFEEYAGKFPEDPAILDRWLARIVRDKGPYDKGAELAEEIQKMRRGPSLPDSYQNVAELYFLKGDKAKAEDIYGKSFIDNQVAVLAYNLIYYANYWIGKDTNKDSALAAAEKALALAPDNSYIIQQAAVVYVKMNKEDKAQALYGPAYMQKNINDASTLNSYAWFWAGQGKNLQSALMAAKKAVELKPKQYYIWDTLATVYAKMKNWAEAIKTMEKAVELAPDSAKESYKKNLEKIKADAAKK